ncbi:Cell surface antigen I/II precursor [Streptococcus agalactiae]|nr:putative cross-wall-targeting lipoprotein signal domain-containing proteiin [Streptococcus agalactiae]CZT40200.1 Cell surface antigen I/II precursor [Streptococcus agalactiae]
MTNQYIKKGHGFFRKKKWAKGLASGIALGAAITVSGAVYADDATNTVETQPEVTVVSNSNATNLADAQADNSQEHTDLTNQAETQTGQLTEKVTSDGLDQSVAGAKQAGVEVDENGTVTHSSYSDAQADLAKQKEAIDQATETQKTVDSSKVAAEEGAKAVGVDVSTEGRKSAKTYTSVEDAKKTSR